MPAAAHVSCCVTLCRADAQPQAQLSDVEEQLQQAAREKLEVQLELSQAQVRHGLVAGWVLMCLEAHVQ